jgi:hypothetical protein
MPRQPRPVFSPAPKKGCVMDWSILLGTMAIMPVLGLTDRFVRRS